MDMEEALQAYIACADELTSALSGLCEADLNRGPVDGWNIRQIVHHIADGDELWKTCILLAMGNPDAEFHLAWYWDISQDDWAESWSYGQRKIGTSLARLRANRLHVVELLRQKPESWTYSARMHIPTQTEECRVSIADVVKSQTDHVQQHLADIRALSRLHSGEGTA